MADSKIGSAYVEVLSKGIAKVQSELGKIKAGLDKAGAGTDDLNKKTKGAGDNASTAKQQFAALSATIAGIGSVATRAFAGGVGAITGFVKAADPVGFMQFQGELARLAVQVGTIFIPILDDATKVVKSVTDCFRGLSDEQKDQIVKWVEIGLAVALGVAVLAKVIGVTQTLLGVMNALGLRTAFVAVAQGAASLASGAWAVVQGILTGTITLSTIATTAWGTAVGIATGGIVPLIGIIVTLIAGMIGVGGAMKAGGDKAGFFGSIIATLMPIFETFKSAFLALWEALQPAMEAFATVLEVVVGVVGTAFEVLGAVVKVTVDLFIVLFQSLMEVVGPILDGIAEQAQLFGDLFEVVGEMVKDVIEGLKPVFEEIFENLGGIMEVFGMVFKGIFLAMKLGIMAVIKTLIYLKTILKEIMRGNFTGATDKANEAVEAYEEKIKEREEEKEEKKRKKEGKIDTGGGYWGKDAWMNDEDKKKRHTPKDENKVEMMGLTEAWKKAQTAGVMTPEQAAADERRKEAAKERAKQTGVLEEIRDNTKADPNSKGASFGW